MPIPKALRGAAAAVAWLACPLLLWGCDEHASSPPTTAAATSAATPKYPIQGFLPDAASSANATGATVPPAAAASGTSGEEEGAENRANDPSAPADTPLCGTAARELAAASAAISPGVMAAGGVCTQTACFDPLTGTYIGADGERHVCQ